MTKTYQITYVKYKVIDIEDEEMMRYGYEAPITDEMRREYLENLLDEEFPYVYDDREVKEICLEN